MKYMILYYKTCYVTAWTVDINAVFNQTGLYSNFNIFKIKPFGSLVRIYINVLLIVFQLGYENRGAHGKGTFARNVMCICSSVVSFLIILVAS